MAAKSDSASFMKSTQLVQAVLNKLGQPQTAKTAKPLAVELGRAFLSLCENFRSYVINVAPGKTTEAYRVKVWLSGIA
jgi:hypothetical protein